MSLRSRAAAIWSTVRKAVTEGPAGLLRGIFPVMGGEPPVRGTRELLETFETMPWIRMIADRVGNSIGQTEWTLYAARGAKTQKIERNRPLQRGSYTIRRAAIEDLRDAGRLVDVDPDHPFYEALDNPNPYMGRMGLLKVTEIHLDLVGDAYWLKARNALGKPAGYWPVPPHWILEHPTPSRPTFRIAHAAWQVVVPERDVSWFHEPTPANPYTRGSGIGWSLGDELQVDEYAAKMAAALFFNRARPDFLVMGDEGTSQDEMRRLKRDWENHNQGFWRAYRPHFLTTKVEIKEFTQQHLGDQLMYPTLRKAQRDIVLQTWSAPPEIFGISEKGNLARTAYEAAEYLYEKYVIAPRVERIRQVLQREAAAEFDERIVVHYHPIIGEDKVHKLAVRKAAPWAWMQDEWRALAGDRPVPAGAGKVYYVPMAGYVTADLLDLEARPKSSPVEPPKPDDDEETGKERDRDDDAA
jgi:hypothetical protein